MEAIHITIEQNSLIDGPTSRPSLRACLHEEGGGGGGQEGGRKYSDILSLGGSPVYVTHDQSMSTSLALILHPSLSILLTFGIGAIVLFSRASTKQSFRASPRDSSAQLSDQIEN